MANIELRKKYENMSKLELLKSYKRFKFVEKFDDAIVYIAPFVIAAAGTGLIVSANTEYNPGLIISSCSLYLSAMPFIAYRSLKNDDKSLEEYEIIKDLLQNKYQIKFPTNEALKKLTESKYNLKNSKESLKAHNNGTYLPSNHIDFNAIKFNILEKVDINKQEYKKAKKAFKEAKKEENSNINIEIKKAESEENNNQ